MGDVAAATVSLVSRLLRAWRTGGSAEQGREEQRGTRRETLVSAVLYSGSTIVICAAPGAADML